MAAHQPSRSRREVPMGSSASQQQQQEQITLSTPPILWLHINTAEQQFIQPETNHIRVKVHGLWHWVQLDSTKVSTPLSVEIHQFRHAAAYNVCQDREASWQHVRFKFKMFSVVIKVWQVRTKQQFLAGLAETGAARTNCSFQFAGRSSLNQMPKVTSALLNYTETSSWI